MKTIICEALRQSGEIEPLIKVAATHNTGHINITPEDISAYLKVRSAVYPGLPQFGVVQDNFITVSDNEGVYMVLTWKEKKEDAPHEAHALVLTDNIS